MLEPAGCDGASGCASTQERAESAARRGVNRPSAPARVPRGSAGESAPDPSWQTVLVAAEGNHGVYGGDAAQGDEGAAHAQGPDAGGGAGNGEG